MIPKEWAVIPFAYLQMVALSANFYIVPQLLIFKVCHKTFNNTVCSKLGKPKFKSHEDYVFRKAAEWNTLINFAGIFPAVILMLPLGSMTDLVSRKTILQLPAIASLLSCLINLCSSFFITLHEGFLVLASFITSTFGDEPGFLALCCAYSIRARPGSVLLAVVVVNASVRTGRGTGSLIVNYLARYYGYSSAFLLATVALVIALLYALIVIPPVDDESKEHPDKESFGFWNDFKEHIKETWLHLVSFMKKHLLHAKDKTMPLLLIVAFLAANGGERALITLFLKHSPLNLKADEIGVYLGLFQLSRAAGLIVLVAIINRCLQLSDYTIMFLGTLSRILNYTALSFSTTKLMVYLTTILACPASFMSSAVRSQMTKLADKEEHGISLSFIALLANSGLLVMSLGANGLFIATATVYSGFSMLLLSFSNLIAFAVVFVIVCMRKHKGATTGSNGESSAEETESSHKQDETK